MHVNQITGILLWGAHNMRKRFFILIAIIILLIFVAGGVLYYATKKQREKEVEKIVPVLQIKQISEEEVISPVTDRANNVIWYFNSDGHLFEVKSTGLSEASIPILPGKSLRTVLWPNEGSDFITISGDLEIQKSYYDSKLKVYINLPKNIRYLSWLPDNKRIIYIWEATDKSSSLAMANADGSGFKTITPVFWPDLVIKPDPDGKTALIYRSNIVGDTNKIYSVNLETGQITTLVDQGKNISAKWIAADKFLYSTDTSIYLYDLTKKQITNLNLNTSLDQLVADSSGKLIYANVSGLFKKIDLTTNTSEIYFDPCKRIETKIMLLVGNTVYFVDKSNNRLYSISK